MIDFLLDATMNISLSLHPMQIISYFHILQEHVTLTVLSPYTPLPPTLQTLFQGPLAPLDHHRRDRGSRHDCLRSPKAFVASAKRRRQCDERVET